MTFPWLSNGGELNAELKAFYQKFGEQYSSEQIDQCATLFATAEQKGDDAPPPTSKERVQQFHRLVSCSQYAQHQILQSPTLLIQLLSEDLLNTKNAQRHHDDLAFDGNDGDFDKHLRKKRQYSMVRILWRDFNRLGTTEQTTAELSFLADAALQLSLDYHYASLVRQYGEPQNQAGARQPFIILGMGKLGAYELNLSSDIDLIFAYPETGQTRAQANEAKSSELDNESFFNKLGKRIIQSLDNTTADGFVFRVDMRLRPYGQSGPLVSHFNALEDYYQNQGREWERYAMIKARVVASNAEAQDIDNLIDLLHRFTYRKYVDFSVINALRDLKRMIVQEVKRRRLEDDIKLGAGGIREIEFIAQVFQLIRGGLDTELQDNRLLYVLPMLQELNCLPEDSVAKLRTAYLFLRDTEHGIQGYNDQQTQRLPDTEHAQHALATVMGFDSWAAFLVQLELHRKNVSLEFSRVIDQPENEDDAMADTAIWTPLWQGSLDETSALELLSEYGHEAPDKSLHTISELRDSQQAKHLHASSRERLDKFIPILLKCLSNSQCPSQTLLRLNTLVRSTIRRSAYLLLLIENPKALAQLITLTQASPWIADRLAEHPALLDELLDSHTLYHLPSKAELATELRCSLLRLEEGDLEAQMETLRHFRSVHSLRVAACEITGALPLMQVSDYLTWLAEVILDQALQLSWRSLTEKHGFPDGQDDMAYRFIVVAYGKMGGIELGHGSDLDIVFVHDASTTGETDGAEDKRIDNQTFYARLGKKIIHFLNTNTFSGRLYEVDMRLRPSGNSGLLVSSMASFEKYQRDAAWTWEHQALVRARVVAGDTQLSRKFEVVREAILQDSRDLQTLKKDVVEMRLKMREHLGNDKNNDGNRPFHLKHDAGGIVDIEFMVQYGVLAWAHADPALVKFTDNIRILESFARSSLLDTQEVSQLIEAYKAFRSLGHRLTLQQESSLIEPERLVSERQTVIRIWNHLLG